MSEHHDNGHGQHGEEAPHATFSGYMIGFMASVFLTAVPFILVVGNVFESMNTTVIIILAFALVQILVHMVFFLHMDFQSQAGWNMLSLIFTAVLVFIVLAGSLWVMYNMNVNMMPSMMS